MVSYTEYHNQSLLAKDIDPSVLCLKYLADRYELNTEQRYWISFLYGTNYCATTTFYIYNEFPDYQMVNLSRLKMWWREKKDKLIFQTDRRRIKSNDQFIDSFISYRSLVRGNQQNYFFSSHWQQIYNKIEKIKYFGRFSLFNYLDVLNQITDITLKPKYLNMLEAESCRNGLCFAIDRPDLIKKNITKKEATYLHNKFLEVFDAHEGNIFQVETTLCAYKKYRYGKRYVGYYIDRLFNEIKQMETDIPEGVAWEVLWDFRRETFDKKYLKEYE